MVGCRSIVTDLILSAANRLTSSSAALSVRAMRTQIAQVQLGCLDVLHQSGQILELPLAKCADEGTPVNQAFFVVAGMLIAVALIAVALDGTVLLRLPARGART